ncbi:AcrR family transcriptional regulator [Kibdelosporangium banguiense]|uniref:AcrR family transcriptional regulator n=1 Tax=Kibdelosporangium banguiense TaxID=1365924 RepID=A0ABS4TDW6_9PSEU|nr:TetR/AcrR family transcriptional regulator [Kibdelosporangium banguiense]MBP2322534.1 AcrR family transcriptional regulator [Kibdelosporangium banguiense]
MSARPLRADAQRNRDRLIETAVQAFSHDGPDVTLDSIAKTAGVGIGTLYRHFPTREALIEAAYRNELEKLTSAAPELLKTMAPDQALRTWMDHFVAYMTTKRGMGDALKALIASGGDPFARSRELITNALGRLLDATVNAGQTRPDINVEDIFMGIAGISMVSESGTPEQAGRLLDLLMDGLRYHP